MFSKTCEYAIRALLFIAQKSRENKRVGTKEIAREIDSPEYFIAKILQDLSRKGYVQSMKGPSGGFYFEEQSLKTSLSEIVRAIDGDKIFSGCAMGLRQCSEQRPCPLHNEFRFIRAEINRMLDQSTLGEFAESLANNQVFLKK